MWKLVELQVCSELAKTFCKTVQTKIIHRSPLCEIEGSSQFGQNWHLQSIFAEVGDFCQLFRKRKKDKLRRISSKRRAWLDIGIDSRVETETGWKEAISCLGPPSLCWKPQFFLWYSQKQANTEIHKIHFAKIDNMRWWNMPHFDLTRCWLCRSKSHFFCQYCGPSIHQNIPISSKSSTKI